MFFIYIIKSKLAGRYYIGVSNNLEKRLSEHNKGKVKSTKLHKPWALLYKEGCETLGEARGRELYLKSLKKRAQIEKIIKNISKIC